MPMSDPTGAGAISDPPPDAQETFERLRRTEATVESLLDALRHQEKLVDDLTAATGAWAETRE